MDSKKKLSILITGKDKVEPFWEEIDNSPPGPDEIIGHTISSLISSGTEIAVITGLLGGDTYPKRIGYAAVIEIDQIGDNVRGLKKGDHILCMAKHTSHQRIASKNAILVPKGVSPDAATFARMMNITMCTMTTSTARPPQKVAVTGLGLVGLMGALVFDACGYEVIACDTDENRRRIAVESGLRAVYPKIPLDDPEIADNVSLVLECSGHEQAVLDACRVVKKRGEVVTVATSRVCLTDLTAQDILFAVNRRYVVLRSGWEWEVPIHKQDFMNGNMMDNMRGALRWLKEGRIKVDDLYTKVDPRDCSMVYEKIKNKQFDKLGIIFDWRSFYENEGY